MVGYITNWLAIKLIFEPVDPVKMGPFVLQGLFLKRQDEVSRRRHPKTVSIFHLESNRCSESASRQILRQNRRAMGIYALKNDGQVYKRGERTKPVTMAYPEGF